MQRSRADVNFDRKWAWFLNFRGRASAPILCPTTIDNTQGGYDKLIYSDVSTRPLTNNNALECM